MQYGLNNNTGVTAGNAENNFSRMNKKITNAGDNARKFAGAINQATELLNEWQNAGTGGEKIQNIAKTIAAVMGK